jgi:hypothetical protein
MPRILKTELKQTEITKGKYLKKKAKNAKNTPPHQRILQH